MKISKITLSFAAIVLSMAVIVTSCKKRDATADSDTGSASDNSLAERTSSDLVTMAAQASDIAVGDSIGAYRKAGGEDVLGLSCATLSWDTTNKKITITFSGSTCLDGHTRSGSILIDYSGSSSFPTHYRTPGFSCTITSTNYVVDGNQVNIVNKTITNTTPVGFNPATTNETWSISANINIVKGTASGGTIKWTANKTKTLLNTGDSTVYRGQSLPIVWSKARIGLAGNESGTTASGETFSATVTSQLIRDMNCSPSSLHPGLHPFIQGTLDFTPGPKAVRHFDYGNGSCDNLATVTINGNTYTITLP